MVSWEQFVQHSGSRSSPGGNLTARYTFLHALYQNVIYDRIGDARRSRLHQSIGERMESVYQGATEEVAAELALHFERGGELVRAVKYLLQSAHLALQQGGFQEALSYDSRGMALVKRLPPSIQRNEIELAFHLVAGTSYSSSRGYAAAEANQAFSSAEMLSRNVKNDRLLFQALAGLWTFHLIRGELLKARRFTREMLRLGFRTRSAPLLLSSHMAAGITLFYLGKLSEARGELKKASTYLSTVN